MAAKTAYLIPNKGAIVRDPETMEILPAGGAVKVLDTYWRRRLGRSVKAGKPPVAQRQRQKEPKTKKTERRSRS